MIYGWFWLALIFLAALITVLSRKNFYSSFAVGAVIPVILDIFKIDLIWQAVAFIAAFVTFLAVMAKFFLQDGDDVSVDYSALVGNKCVVIEEIDNTAGCGQVKINGQSWSARAVIDTEVYKIGQTLSVVAVEGVKLICRG